MTAPATPYPSAQQEQSSCLRDFIRERYLPFIRKHKRSWKMDERYLASYVLPHLGMLSLEKITTASIEAWLCSLKKSGLSDSSCYRVFWLLKYVLNCAVRWKILKNDAAFCDAEGPRVPSGRSPHILSEEELRRLLALLKEHDSLPGARAIHLLLLTGAGKSEILSARWEDVHLDEHLILLRHAYTGQPKFLPLNSEATALIRSLPRRKGVPWLFSSPSGGRLTSLFYAWNLLRTKLGRPDLRIQDLRYSGAGVLLPVGLRSGDVHDIMGHYKPRTPALTSQPSFVKKELS